jgi:hypothetical protein
MLNGTLMAAIAAERVADFERDAAKQRRARQVPAGITRRGQLQRRLHAGPAKPAQAHAATHTM